jgi:CRP-like cAMP-binding protein
LRSLSPQEFERLTPHLTTTTLTRGQILHGASRAIEDVYFPMKGLCGLVAVTQSGLGVDVAPVGCEGVTGVYSLASPHASARVLVEVGPVEALRLPIAKFDEEMDRRERLHSLVTGYYRAFVTEVVESVACHRLHSTLQRYSRRLLTISDRLGSDSFTLTHDLMASMLGIQRPAVSGMALTLKHSGAIDYSRGKISILDRAAIEASACECYRTARARIAHLLPPRAERGPAEGPA